MQYVVQPGDSLWRIAVRWLGDGNRWPEIARDNGILAADRLLIGRRLILRSQRVVRVSPADWAKDALSDPRPEHQPSVVPARAFSFVLADELDPRRAKVVRKVMVCPALAESYSRELGKRVKLVADPQRFGLHPVDPGSTLPRGRHAMGMEPSAFQSVSLRPFGTPRMAGRRYWIDVEKAKAAGARFHDTEAILEDLDRIARKLRKPDALARIERTRCNVRFDAEQLVTGSIPPSAIKGARAMALTRGLQVVQITAFVLTAVDLERAAVQSIRSASVRPIAAETLRQAGGWGAAWAGMKLGALAGTAVGLELGPGAVASAAIGAIAGGTAGYLGFDWIADAIAEN